MCIALYFIFVSYFSILIRLTKLSLSCVSRLSFLHPLSFLAALFSLSNVLVFVTISLLCFGFSVFRNLTVHAINTFYLFWYRQIIFGFAFFNFSHSLLNLVSYLQCFMISVQCAFVCLQLRHPLCICSFLFLFLCVFLFSSFLLYRLFLYCLTVFQCSAPPCALTSHLWSAVCPMCHITLARTFFAFGSFLCLSFI